jgi:ubiquinone/menaquinone biosynthesis C-methylase UbiE
MHERRFEGAIERLRSPERVDRLEVERVVDLCFENGPIASVLDVGTGSGLFAEAFARHGAEVSGVDVNAEMLIAARRFVPGGDFREGVAEQLPFPDGRFDLVFLGLVLHEADDAVEALNEARRTAREGVGVLEWPYRDQSFGPPITDRLRPEDLEDLFPKAGFRTWKATNLSNTDFYLLEI